MKKLITLFLSGMSTALIAQIPNLSFENWTSGAPNGWSVVSILSATVTQSATAHAGSSAVELNTVALGPNFISGAIRTGTGSGYVLNSGNFSSLSGWYQLNVSGSDYLSVSAVTKCSGNNPNGGGVTTMTTNAAVYTQFTIPINYSNGCPADSAMISIGLINSAGGTHAGSYAIIDDLSLGAVNAVADISDKVTLEKVYPNPANTVCNIIYSIPSTGLVNISLFDISGRKIKTLLDDTQQNRGRYKVPVNVTDLANGVYIYRVTVDGQSYAQRLTVAK